MENGKLPKVGVGAVIQNEENKILLVLRKKHLKPAVGVYLVARLTIWKQ